MKGKLLTFEEVRNIQIQLLFSLADYCESHSLRYSMAGGTLIGAVRHKGFIPWDDDVDVIMPRPDYESFLKEYNHANYSIAHYRNQKDHYHPFAKLYDDRTITDLGTHSRSVYVDIFPIDAINDFDDYYIKDKEMHSVCHYLDHYRYFIIKQKNSNCIIRLYKYLLWIKFLFKIRGIRQYIHSPYSKAKHCDAVLSSPPFGSTSLSASITGTYGEKEIMPTSSFLEYTTLPFEGRLLSCIKEYDTFLTLHYGDYMQLPPKKQQIAKHNLKYYWKESD